MLEQLRIEEMLRFGKTAQTGRAAADFALDFIQLAGLAQPAHGGDDGIEDAQQKEAGVIIQRQFLVCAPARYRFTNRLDPTPATRDILSGQL